MILAKGLTRLSPERAAELPGAPQGRSSRSYDERRRGTEGDAYGFVLGFYPHDRRHRPTTDGRHRATEPRLHARARDSGVARRPAAPDFRRLWAAQGISDLGDGLTMLTLMLLVNQLTGSTLALAAVAIALAIPPLTIGLVAGTYADRWDRRRIMLVSDSLRAVVVLGFVFIDSADHAAARCWCWRSSRRPSARSSRPPAARSCRASCRPRACSRPTPSPRPRGSSPASSAAGLAGLIVGVLGETWPAFVLDAGDVPALRR